MCVALRNGTSFAAVNKSHVHFKNSINIFKNVTIVEIEVETVVEIKTNLCV